MLVGGNEVYIEAAFDNEEEIEKVVLDNAEALFGSASLYLPKSSVATLGGRVTVPDGIVINLQTNQWYIVEAEMAVHGTWEHIAPQISKQLAAVQRTETKERVLQAALNLVRSSEDLKETIRELGIAEIGLHGRIASILASLPTVAIPIDEIPADLPDWKNSLRNPVKIWVIKKYVQQGTSKILYSLPDEASPSIGTSITEGDGPSVSTSVLLKEAIKTGLFQVGEELWMEYGPRGHPRQRFTAVVRDDGLEVDGKIYSPSAAAVVCIRKAGSHRTSANGWVHWRTRDGRIMSEVVEKLYGQLRQRILADNNPSQ